MKATIFTKIHSFMPKPGHYADIEGGAPFVLWGLDFHGRRTEIRFREQEITDSFYELKDGDQLFVTGEWAEDHFAGYQLYRKISTQP